MSSSRIVPRSTTIILIVAALCVYAGALAIVSALVNHFVARGDLAPLVPFAPLFWLVNLPATIPEPLVALLGGFEDTAAIVSRVWIVVGMSALVYWSSRAPSRRDGIRRFALAWLAACAVGFLGTSIRNATALRPRYRGIITSQSNEVMP